MAEGTSVVLGAGPAGRTLVDRLMDGDATDVRVVTRNGQVSVPDIARALVTVAGADDAVDQAWNVPNAPDRTLREAPGLFARAYDEEAKVQTMPGPPLTVMGLFDANVGEMEEMLYRWDRPFRVDATKFAQRFWSDATTFEDGVAITAPTYVAD